MFTQCPECMRQFRIRADQLTAASGQVKCGYCGNQFNALQSLRDQPRPPENAETGTGEFDAGDTALEETGAANEEVLVEPEFSLPPEPEFDLDDAFRTDPESGPDEDMASRNVAGMDAEPAGEPGSVHTKSPRETPRPGSHYEFPGDYLEEAEERPGRRSRLLWGLGSVLLMLALVLQAAWFFRDRVLTRFPQLAPHVQEFCQRFDCRVTRYSQLEGVRLVNRDVREHPRYRDSLLVNATMINESGNIQPYPRIQLRLFDTRGKLIGWRQFLPEEYLDDSIDRAAGMDVNVPVHFVLEVTGPTEDAVSFEFDFLDNSSG